MRIFLISMMLVCGMTTLSAQTMSKKALFHQTVDYVNCKVVEISMRNSRDIELLNRYQQACPCTLGNTSTTFGDISEFLKGEDIDKTLSLSSEINSAKKEYSPNMTDVGMIEVLADHIFQEKYAQVYAFRKNLKHNTNVEALRANIKEKLTVYIEPFFSDGFTPDEADIAPAKPAIEPKGTDPSAQSTITTSPEDIIDSGNKGSSNALRGLTSILFLLGCISLGALLYQRTKKYRKLEDLYKTEKEKSRSYEQLLLQRDAEKEVYVKQVADKNRKLEELEMLLASRAQVATTGTTATNAADTELAASQEEFYLSTPNEDGSFNDQGKSKIFKPSASLYHFVVSEKDPHVAAFAFVNEESAIVRALNYPDTCLLPVCLELNAHNIDARAIKTEEPGLVELVNDKWILKEKARILYV